MTLSFRRAPTHFFILLAFALMPSWKAWANAPKPFTATYVLGFVVVAPMLLAIASWILTGLPNHRALWQNSWRLAWTGCIVAFIIWAYLSQVWDFVSPDRVGVVQNGTLQLAIVFGFAMVCLCCPPKPQHVITVLVISLIINALIGGAQVLAQSEIGLNALGELKNIDPLKSGVSVVQSGDMRWLRPYGLVPHPNVYAGVLVVGLLACMPLLLHPTGRVRWLALVPFALGVWLLGLSFSRGAWLAWGITITGCVVWLWRNPVMRRRLLVPFVMLVILAGTFFALYRPFIFARAGIGEENTELRSISDRIVFNQIAFDIIYEVPVQGVGMGNFAWYATWYINTQTDFDLRGTNVHQIALLILSELGFVGFGLFALILTLGVGMSLHQLWRTRDDTARLAFLGAVIALGIIGMVDHYPYTLVQFFGLWMTLLALSFADSPFFSARAHFPPSAH
jgi:O-antigen ligase